jgi:double-stranded uracil-DNA glycosylase
MVEPLKHCFAPVADEHTRVLILGSLPGEVSLARGQYYAHPRNLFWRLMEAVIEQPLVALSYDKRLQVLCANKIGLWDMVGSARREGSLDAAIQAENPNDLRLFAHSVPELRAIGFNGAKSASLGMKQLKRLEGIDLIRLPSSSPANAQQSFEEKRSEWLKLRAFL